MQIPKGIKKTAIICILKNGNKFLLLKRNKEPNINTFTPVGGKLEPFENPNDAAIRETFEETGIKISVPNFCGVLIENSPTDYNWTLFTYSADIDLIAPPKSSEGILEWIDFENILKVPTPKTDWFIYKYILENKHFVLNADYNENLELIKMTNETTNEIVYDKSTDIAS